MKWSRRQQAAQELDIYGEPTEPSMPAVKLPPSSPPLDWYPQPTNGTQFSAARSPQTSYPNVPKAQTETPSSWHASVYPILPRTFTPSDFVPNQQTVGGRTQSYPVRPPSISSRNMQRKHSHLPAFIDMFFMAVQILLLVRFALRLLVPTISSGTPLIGILYTVSDMFVLPFRLLFQYVPFPISGNVEIYTLVAILCYGLLSRVLARLTKALIHSL